jgi:hypothetical protein
VSGVEYRKMTIHLRMKSARAMRALLGALLLSVLATAQAHHSFAMFDQTKALMMTGTVTEFHYENPHIHWRMLVMPPKGGSPVSYLLEGPTPVILKRLGWTRKSLVVGDKIKVKMYPLRDGTPGGQGLYIWLADGKELSLVAEDVKDK